MKKVMAALLVVGSVAFAQEFGWSASQRKELAKRAKTAASTTKDGATYLSVAGKTYDVHTQNVDADYAAELSLFMDSFSDQFQQLIPGKNLVGRRPEVFLYGTQDAFKQKWNGSNARGFYDCKWDGNGQFTLHALFTYRTDKEKTFGAFYRPILLHEGTHQLLRERFGKLTIPPALDEGLATYFQLWDLGMTPQANLAARSKSLINKPEFMDYWNGQRWPLKEIMSLQRSGWDPDNMGPVSKRQYAAVEGLFLAFMSDGAGRKVVKAWLDDVASKVDPVARYSDADLAKLDAKATDYVLGTVLGRR